MLIQLLLFAGGLGLLLVGGELLVRGASSLARSLGIPSTVIGLTVVAFGTSLPELVVNLRAAMAGAADIAWGNVHGSNLANLGLILGLSGLLAPLRVESRIVRRELPWLVVASLIALALSSDSWLEGSTDRLARGDGLALLLLFCGFLYVLASDARRARAEREPLIEQLPAVPRTGVRRELVRCLGGLVALIAGGQLAVDAARALATAWGLPEVVIGLTIVAIGTSLPELVTTFVAARRGETDLAVANVVGSNLFNLMLVLGSGAALAPGDVPPGGLGDLAVGALLAGLLVILGRRRAGAIGRPAAGALLAGWAGWTAYRALAG